MVELSFLSRGSEGIKHYTYPSLTTTDTVVTTAKRCSGIYMSADGEIAAVCNGEETTVFNMKTNSTIMTLPRKRTMMMVFSPLKTHLATWCPYIISDEVPENTPNLEIWSVVSPQDKPVHAYVNRRQTGWEPQWSQDESVCARLCNNEVQFYENNDFTKVVNRIQRDKLGGVFMSTHLNPVYVGIYVPSLKGAHAFVQLYQYGSFDRQAAIAHRSFMKVDACEVKWNSSGKYGIVIASCDVDKSGASYYGQTLLYFISSRGESNQIVLNKTGPVYSVEWNPASDEFIVIYGFMPCRATMFNTKCDPIFEFGDGHRNEVCFNPQGNMVGLNGFGNLRGKMEYWDVKARKKLSEFTADNTTFFEWCPSGDIFITGTLAPRLRQDNEFKIWNVSGEVLHHHKVPEEVHLWQLKWVNPPTVLPDPVIPRAASAKEISSAKPQAYRPPSARNGAGSAPRSLIDKLPNVDAKGVYKPGMGNNNERSKNQVKHQKKRENVRAEPAKQESAPQEFQKAVVDENEKKLRNLKKKLHQVEKLKAQVKEGKQLEKNQLDKIGTEAELIAEIKKLEV